MKTIKEIREYSGMSRAEFSRAYEIPIRTLENWESGNRSCPPYLLNFLQRIVVEDKKIEPIDCYDKDILREIGYCYCGLLHVMNKVGKNPYPQVETFPMKYFTMVYMQASKMKIPNDLNERIGQLLNHIDPDKWAEIMETPVPMDKRQFFIIGNMEFKNK